MNNKPSTCCPGVNSENSGKDKACEGCPNVSYCLGEKKVDRYLEIIKKNIKKVSTIICIMSGKGGVGKSTICRNLAEEISKKVKVCILDLDVCGPSIPKLTDTEEVAMVHNEKIYPIEVHKNLSSISMSNFEKIECLDSSGKTSLIRKILGNTDFSSVQTILIDTPPNISDEHLALVNYVKVDHVIIVTTPHILSLNDVRRQIDFCRKAKFKILGVISNMDGFTCASCGHFNNIFTGNVKGFCDQECLSYLGSISIDQSIAKKSDAGLSFNHKVLEEVAKIVEKRL